MSTPQPTSSSNIQPTSHTASSSQTTNAHQPDPSNPHLRRSTRPHIPPSHLDDYLCHVPHTLSNHLTYDRLSNAYKKFVLTVSEHYEPEFYHQAVKPPEWREAMAAEIAALEANDT